MKTNVNSVFTGKSGKGKGWFMGLHIEDSTKPRVIWDKKGEHAGLAENVLRLDLRRFEAMEARNPKRIWADALDSYPSVRIFTHGLEPVQLQAAAGACATAVHERGKRLWAASEYHTMAPNKGSGLGETPGSLLVLHTDARTCQVDIAIDTQRPALVNTTIMSQCNRRIGFGMDDENDLKRYAGAFNLVPADQLALLGLQDLARGRDRVPAKEVFPRMPPMRCLYLDCDTSEQHIIDTSKLTRRTQHHG